MNCNDLPGSIKSLLTFQTKEVIKIRSDIDPEGENDFPVKLYRSVLSHQNSQSDNQQLQSCSTAVPDYLHTFLFNFNQQKEKYHILCSESTQ